MAGRAEHQARWTRWNHALADDADEQTSEVSSLRTIRRTLEYPLFKMPWIEPFLRFCSNFPLTCVLLLHLSAVHGECARPPVENRRRTCFYSLGIQIRSWEGQTVMHHDHVVCVVIRGKTDGGSMMMMMMTMMGRCACTQSQSSPGSSV